MADMQEASLEERKRKLEKLRDDLSGVDERLSEMKGQNKGLLIISWFILFL